MCQNFIPNELAKLENEVRDMIMLEDSTHGTLCAIHSAVHTPGHFPHSNHQMLRICPVPRCPTNSRIPVKNKRLHPRSRSPSPRLQTCTNKSRFSQHKNVFSPCQNRREGHSNVNTTGPVTSLNIEKTFSCPGKMCVYVKRTPSSKTNLTCKSSVQIDDRLANSIMATDEIVNELKDEIERVKHQLFHIAVSKAKSEAQAPQADANSVSQVQTNANFRNEDDATNVNKLRVNNKRLRRELEVKKKLLENSKKDVEKARDILNDYEMKVTLLHQQAIKSSKAMKSSKERFCKCLKDKEERIQALRKDNESLRSTIIANGNDSNRILEENDKLKRAFEETCAKCCELNESNQNYCTCVEDLMQKLEKSSRESEQYKSTMESIEKKLEDMNCACRKLTTKYKKQKETYENQLKTKNELEKKMSVELSNLSLKLLETENSKRLNSTEVDKLQGRCLELESKLTKYDSLEEKCKGLEEECKTHCETLMRNEMTFQKSQEEMQSLIQELTTVVEENKKTLLEMSDTNKAQEILIKTQSFALMSKEEQLRVIEKQSENFKKKTEKLEKEVQELKRSTSLPCNKEICLSVSKELEQIKKELNEQKDNHRIAEKIIQDQSQTIVSLQSQVKEKIHEVTKAQSDTKSLENQVKKINEKLQIKHRELNKQINEKEDLVEKLKILEKQKHQLTEEIQDFEEMLHKFKETCGENEDQRDILKNLKQQIDNQKQEWYWENQILAKEKEKAVSAAKFATKKLLDTVSDFQKQVDAQKKVQMLLTKMLHEKDDQLKIVTSKIADINHLTSNRPYDIDIPLKELFKKHSGRYAASEPNATTSHYSSCSSHPSHPRSFDLPFQPTPESFMECRTPFSEPTYSIGNNGSRDPRSFDLPFQSLPDYLLECRASCSKLTNNSSYKCNRQCAKVHERFDMLKNSRILVQNEEEPIREFQY